MRVLILAGLIFVSSVLSTPTLSERHSCVRDTLLDLFHDLGHFADEFCVSYIHVPTSTYTVHTHATVTLTKTIVTSLTKDVDHTSTKTASTTKTITESSTATHTSSITVQSTVTSTSLTTTTSTLTSTSTDEIESTITSSLTTTTSTTTTVTSTSIAVVPDAPAQRRNLDRRGVHQLADYSPSQLSSACSCLSIHPTTTKTVIRHSTYTKTVHTTKATTSTKDFTERRTKTLTSSVLSVKTKTDDVTTHVTSTATSFSTVLDSTETTTTTSSTSFTTTSLAVSTETDTTTTSTTTTTTVIPGPSVAFCAGGSQVNGLASTCPGCQTFILRIETADDTPFEGPILAGPGLVTTPSGGAHECDGKNGASNANAGGTPTTALSNAASLCGFGFDGTFQNEFDDFFITSIGDSAETSTEFWGLLVNFQFTPVPGCQTEPASGAEVLWAFDAFNALSFLDIQPRTATLGIGDSVTFTVSDGTTHAPRAGATFDGGTSDANGKVTFTATETGFFRFKARADNTIRSPAVEITVN